MKNGDASERKDLVGGFGLGFFSDGIARRKVRRSCVPSPAASPPRKPHRRGMEGISCALECLMNGKSEKKFRLRANARETLCCYGLAAT